MHGACSRAQVTKNEAVSDHSLNRRQHMKKLLIIGAQFNPNPTNLDQFGVGGIGNTPTGNSGGGGGAYDSSGTLSTGK